MNNIIFVVFLVIALFTAIKYVIRGINGSEGLKVKEVMVIWIVFALALIVSVWYPIAEGRILTTVQDRLVYLPLVAIILNRLGEQVRFHRSRKKTRIKK